MKYKRQLMSSMLAFTMLLGGSSVFAADVNATSTKVSHVSNQLKMKDRTIDKATSTTDKKINKKGKTFSKHKKSKASTTPEVLR